ncbi:MAG: DUF4382 domain-containing protein [Flavobacteriaceae bacterium]
MVRTVVVLIVAFVLLGIPSSCSLDEYPERTGRLNIKMTDAPFPYHRVKEANVTVFHMELRKAVTAGEAHNAQWIHLPDTEIEMNLLELTNGITQPLADSQVPMGRYDRIRIYIKKVYLVMKDGQVINFNWPQGEAAGITIAIHPHLEIQGGGASELLLDFDVGRSFLQVGAKTTDQFVFKPNIRASDMAVSVQLTGRASAQVRDSISRNTQKGLEGVRIGLYTGDTLQVATYTNADGDYMLMGIPAGSYDFKASMDGYDDLFIERVMLSPEYETLLDVELFAKD